VSIREKERKGRKEDWGRVKEETAE